MNTWDQGTVLSSTRQCKIYSNKEVAVEDNRLLVGKKTTSFVFFKTDSQRQIFFVSAILWPWNFWYSQKFLLCCFAILFVTGAFVFGHPMNIFSVQTHVHTRTFHVTASFEQERSHTESIIFDNKCIIFNFGLSKTWTSLYRSCVSWQHATLPTKI